MGRTALHYAAAIPDAGYIYSTLVTAGANEDVNYYYYHCSIII